MPTQSDLDLLPPALRMAAASSAARVRPPMTVKLPPGKNKSFLMRKEQADALAKIRCAPREDMEAEDQKRKQTLLRRQSNKLKVQEEAQAQMAMRQSEIIMDSMVESPKPSPKDVVAAQIHAKARMSWQRSDATEGVAGKRASALKQQAAAVRERVQQLKSTAEEGEQPKHSQDILQKKLDKVEKLLQTEAAGSKEYKKLAKKKEQYQAELEAYLLEQEETQAKADALAQAVAEAEQLDREAELAEEQERLERQARQQKAEEEEAAAAAAQKESAMEEEARLLRERAAALKAKRASETAQSAAPAPASPPAPAPAPAEPVVMDEKERIRQERIEEYRRKMAEKKEEEDAAKAKAERLKEFKVLKKKLQKLEGMIEEAAASSKDTSKLEKKKLEYISQLEEYDEWQEEVKARLKTEEEARLRKEHEEAERERMAALEAERRRKAEEEAERRRAEAEEARREMERLEKERQEEEERMRLQRLEDEKRMAEEAEARRIQEEEEAEAMRIREAEQAAREAEEAEVRAAREAEEAELRAAREAEQAAREAEEAEVRAAREAEEAELRTAREAEMAAERAEQEKINAERRRQEEAEAAQRREELREQTKAAEAEYASQQAQRPAAATQAEPSQDFVDRHNIPEPHSANTKKILAELSAVEDRQVRLEKTLKQNGIAISEDIPYEVAKDKIAALQEQMKALAVSEDDQQVVQKKYYALEEEMSKYVTAMMLTDEFAEEQRMAEQLWEESIEVDNIAALRKVRSHMPVNIRNMTEDELTNNPTPNGKMLPKEFAKKFKRTNVLQLIRVNPDDLERMHPSLIEGLRSTGLTLTERRALHEHLKDVGAVWQDLQQDPSIERKFSWFMGLKSKFKEMVTAYDKHVKEYGPPSNHPYAKRNDPKGGGCPLIGNQCPVKADSAISYDDDYGFTQDAEYEGGSTGGSASKSRAVKAIARKSMSGAKAKDEAIMDAIRERIHLSGTESAIDSKLLRELFHAEKRTISLEKQLAQNGIALPKEDIPFAVAKAKVAEITEEIKIIATKMGNTMDMKEMAGLEKEYSQLSDELEKYNNAMMLTKEWAEELLEKERQWEARVRPDNLEALRKLRRHMPVNIKDLSEQDLIQGITPNGKQLPQKIVRKIKRTNILQLVRMPPSMIEPMHPSSLEGMRSTGLTLTERRALHEHLKDLGAKWKAASNDKMAERKWMWHESLRSKFKELVDKWQEHVDQYGPPGHHPYAKRGEPGGGCPLIGKQCPLKADEEIDYSEDYGFPPEDVYNVEQVKKSNLLTVEELERRKQDDDWGYDAPVQQEPEPVRPPTAGLMTSIGARSGGGGDSAPPPKLAGGLMSAIAAKGGGNDDRPKMGGGLMAAIAAKAEAADNPPKMQDTDSEAPVAKKRMGGLLAAIAGRGKK